MFSHCKKERHDDSHYWKLYFELRPHRFEGKIKKKTIARVQ